MTTRAFRAFLAAAALCGAAGIAHAADAAFAYDAKGKRDPFVPLITGQKQAPSTLEDVVSIEDVRLEGIATGKQGKAVVILNGVMLKENDVVGSIHVKKITDDAVTLVLDDKSYDLALKKEKEAGPEGTN